MIMRTQSELDRLELPLVHHHHQLCLRSALLTGPENLTEDEQYYLVGLDVYIQTRETAALKETLGHFNLGSPVVEA